ncbi:MAG: cyclase family protein [Candidatus Competibacteraceae bacterium]|nr:cyclase family protein [Candidatus Competibacteraceae bacterium]
MLEKFKIIDVTRELDEQLPIYADDQYRDPHFLVETWCTVDTQGYWVSQLSLGTQTGTHIDAPAHFKAGGETLDMLPVRQLMGRYFLIDLNRIVPGQSIGDLLTGFSGEGILFLQSSGAAEISMAQLEQLCSLAAKVWVLVGTVEVRDKQPLHFHSHIAERGIFLVEDLDPNAAQYIKPGGELIALPLRLNGLSGSPCRVLVLQ